MMPSLDQACVKFAIVVNLTVKDDGRGFVLVKDWLISAGDVDDAEAAKCETGLSIKKNARRIRATMDDGGPHAF